MYIYFPDGTIVVRNYGTVFLAYCTVRKISWGYGTKLWYGILFRYGVRLKIPYRTVLPALPTAEFGRVYRRKKLKVNVSKNKVIRCIQG